MGVLGAASVAAPLALPAGSGQIYLAPGGQWALLRQQDGTLDAFSTNVGLSPPAVNVDVTPRPIWDGLPDGQQTITNKSNSYRYWPCGVYFYKTDTQISQSTTQTTTSTSQTTQSTFQSLQSTTQMLQTGLQTLHQSLSLEDSQVLVMEGVASRLEGNLTQMRIVSPAVAGQAHIPAFG